MRRGAPTSALGDDSLPDCWHDSESALPRCLCKIRAISIIHSSYRFQPTRLHAVDRGLFDQRFGVGYYIDCFLCTCRTFKASVYVIRLCCISSIASVNIRALEAC